MSLFKQESGQLDGQRWQPCSGQGVLDRVGCSQVYALNAGGEASVRHCLGAVFGGCRLIGHGEYGFGNVSNPCFLIHCFLAH